MRTSSIKSKILEALKNFSNPVSGEFLAKTLGVSRTAIWKHIQSLKKKGYQIESTPKGYKLLAFADILSPEELSELPLKVYYFKQITSTMDFAKEIGEKGEEALVLAEVQTCGRGRLGRSWKSPEGGIWMSLVIKPPFSLKEAFFLTYIASLSTALSIEKTTGIKTYLKWPNDVLCKLHNKEKKIAGILLEVKAEVDAIKYAIIGIGINVNNKIKDSEPSAISLKELLNKEVRRKDIVINLVNLFQKFLKEKPEKILAKWKEKSITLGRRVKIVQPQREIIGLAIDIAEDGALILKGDNNQIYKVYSGDCIHAFLEK